MEIKNELKGTAINITCINRLGEVVKRVNASGADEEGDYEVVLSCSPQNGGTVEGAGMYDENESAQIKATPAKGFRFLKWSDGVENAERNLAVTDDISLIAIFESEQGSGSSSSSGSNGSSSSNGSSQGSGTSGESGSNGSSQGSGASGESGSNGSSGATGKYKLTLSTNNAELGTTTPADMTEYEPGTTVTIKANIIDDEAFFDGWSDGNEEQTRQIVMDKDMTLEARFSK